MLLARTDRPTKRSGGCRRGRWRRPRRRWRRHEPAPGSGGGTSARRHRRLTRSECTPLRLRSDLPSGGGLPICPTTSGHPPTLHLTAPSLPVARAPADRGSRRAVGWRRPRSELIVRPARRAVRAESSALSRGAEGRPPMPERRLERAREHQLTQALQAPPEASTGSFQARRAPDRAAWAWGQGWTLCVRRVCGRRYVSCGLALLGSLIALGEENRALDRKGGPPRGALPAGRRAAPPNLGLPPRPAPQPPAARKTRVRAKLQAGR